MNNYVVLVINVVDICNLFIRWILLFIVTAKNTVTIKTSLMFTHLFLSQDYSVLLFQVIYARFKRELQD